MNEVIDHEGPRAYRVKWLIWLGATETYRFCSQMNWRAIKVAVSEVDEIDWLMHEKVDG